MSTKRQPAVALAGQREDDAWRGALEFRTLAETIPALVFVTNARGQNIYTNVQFQRFTGLTPQALLNDGWRQALHPDDRAHADAIWAQSVENAEDYEARYRFCRADGVYRWHLVRGAPMLGVDGRVVRWMGSCTDIEDIVQVNVERERFDNFLRAVGTSGQLILYIKDEDGRFVFVNDAVLAIMGCVEGDVLNRSLADFPNALVEQIMHNDRAVLESGVPQVFEESWPGLDGTRHFRSVKAPMLLGDGRTGLAAVSYEMTNESDLRDQNRKLDNRLHNWLEAIPLIAWESDCCGMVTAVSQAWRDAAGLAQLPGPFSLSDVIVDRDRVRIADLWEFAIATSEMLDAQTVVYDRLDQKERPVRLVATPGRHGSPEDAPGWYGSMVPVGS